MSADDRDDLSQDMAPMPLTADERSLILTVRAVRTHQFLVELVQRWMEEPDAVPQLIAINLRVHHEKAALTDERNAARAEVSRLTAERDALSAALAQSEQRRKPDTLGEDEYRVLWRMAEANLKHAADEIVSAQRREAEAYRLRAVAVETVDALTVERDQLAAIVGVECPIGDLSLVESLRAVSAHAGQYAEEMQAERDAALRRERALRDALVEDVEYDDGTLMRHYRRCVLCLEDDQHGALVHNTVCVLAARQQPPAAEGESVVLERDRE